jgi:hypothetical protein
LKVSSSSPQHRNHAWYGSELNFGRLVDLQKGSQWSCWCWAPRGKEMREKVMREKVMREKVMREKVMTEKVREKVMRERK